MANSMTYSSIGVVLLMVASMLVVAQQDPCSGVQVNTAPDRESCEKCVGTVVVEKVKNCTFETTRQGPQCVTNATAAEAVTDTYTSAISCQKLAPEITTTAPPPTTSTTTASPNTTTAATTTVPPTTTTTTTTPSPPTTTSIPTTTTPNSTSTSTTPIPSTTTASPNGTTSTTAAPHPAPSGRGGMSFASFFAGIVFTLCMSGLGYLIWRFYKARMDRNYHTLSTNLI